MNRLIIEVGRAPRLEPLSAEEIQQREAEDLAAAPRVAERLRIRTEKRLRERAVDALLEEMLAKRAAQARPPAAVRDYINARRGA